MFIHDKLRGGLYYTVQSHYSGIVTHQWYKSEFDVALTLFCF